MVVSGTVRVSGTGATGSGGVAIVSIGTVGTTGSGIGVTLPVSDDTTGRFTAQLSVDVATWVSHDPLDEATPSIGDDTTEDADELAGDIARDSRISLSSFSVIHVSPIQSFSVFTSLAKSARTESFISR